VRRSRSLLLLRLVQSPSMVADGAIRRQSTRT
jgi:hypothetical protein